MIFEPSPLPAPPRQRPRLVPSLVVAVILASVVYAVLMVANYRLPYLLLLALSSGLLLLRWAAGLVAEPSWLRTGDLVRPVRVRRRLEPGQWYEGGDGMAEAIRTWDRRFGWGETDGNRWGRAVGRHLGELVDERLRQRYGITRATHPERARSLVGERVWALLGPLERPPTPRQVTAALDDLDRMPDDLDETEEKP